MAAEAPETALEDATPAEAVALVVRFLLELGVLVSLGYWGTTALDGPVRFVVAAAGPIVAILVWGFFVSPRAPRRLDDPARLVVELVVFGAGVAALSAADQPLVAAAFGLVVLLDLLALIAWDLR